MERKVSGSVYKKKKGTEFPNLKIRSECFSEKQDIF